MEILLLDRTFWQALPYFCPFCKVSSTRVHEEDYVQAYVGMDKLTVIVEQTRWLKETGSMCPSIFLPLFF